MINNALDFTSKRVLVCGGSDGIGYGIAQAFVTAGATVAITGTRERDAYERNFSAVEYHRLDVRDGDAIDALAGEFTLLDCLINASGSVLWHKQEFQREGFEQVLSINLTGIMHLCTAFYPLLCKSAGNIVNLDSVASIRPALNNPAYSASKAGLAQLTRTLAMKWGRDGVRVNGVSPGLVATKLTANQTGADNEAAFSQRNPIGRLGTPDDMAAAALFLASPLASYITGHCLVVDGGLSL